MNRTLHFTSNTVIAQLNQMSTFISLAYLEVFSHFSHGVPEERSQLVDGVIFHRLMRVGMQHFLIIAAVSKK